MAADDAGGGGGGRLEELAAVGLFNRACSSMKSITIYHISFHFLLLYIHAEVVYTRGI